VAARLYRQLGVEDPVERADRLVEWLSRLPVVTVACTDAALAQQAGRIKLDYKLALTDCYVIAAAKIF
jgi:predicted nucleic acid-binding protein